jgi:hypothetical protein
LALTNQASAAASRQSILPNCSRSSSRISQISSNLPVRVHSSNRRQQVLAEG